MLARLLAITSPLSTVICGLPITECNAMPSFLTLQEHLSNILYSGRKVEHVSGLCKAFGLDQGDHHDVTEHYMIWMEDMQNSVGDICVPEALIPKRVCAKGKSKTFASILAELCLLQMDEVEECRECGHQSPMNVSTYTLSISLPVVKPRHAPSQIKWSPKECTEVNPKAIDLQHALEDYFTSDRMEEKTCPNKQCKMKGKISCTKSIRMPPIFLHVQIGRHGSVEQSVRRSKRVASKSSESSVSQPSREAAPTTSAMKKFDIPLCIQSTIVLTDRDFNEHEYVPYAVGLHEGTEGSHGHWTLQFKHYMNGGVWYTADDEDMTAIDGVCPDYIFEECAHDSVQSNEKSSKQKFLKGNSKIAFVQLVKKSAVLGMIEEEIHNWRTVSRNVSEEFDPSQRVVLHHFAAITNRFQLLDECNRLVLDMMLALFFLFSPCFNN